MQAASSATARATHAIVDDVDAGPADPVARPAGGAATPIVRARYLTALAWCFAVFNAARVVAYLPTIWAIWASGDSRQHSWFTWLTWTGANLTMAAWLYEQDAHRLTRAVAVNACNAGMCLATLVLIVVLRLG